MFDRLTKSQSLTTKIVLRTIVVLVIVMAAATWVQSWQQRNVLTDKLHEHSEELAQVIENSLREGMIRADDELMASAVTRLGAMPTVRRVYIANLQGEVRRSSSAGDIGTSIAGPTLDQIKGGAQGTMDICAAADGKRFLSRLAPVRAEEACISCHSDSKVGDAIGYIGLDRWAEKDMTHLARNQAMVILMSVVTVLVLVGVLGYLLSRATKPIVAMAGSAQKIAQGDLGQVVDYRSSDQVGALADSFREMITYLSEMSRAADCLARGDLTVELQPRSDADALSRNFNRATEALRGLVAQTGALTTAAVNGDLAGRGDPTQFEGAYRQVVQGINDTMDAVIGPLNTAAKYFDSIAKGEIPPKLTEEYRGDFIRIKNNLNECCEAVNALVADTQKLSTAAVDGQLSTRADASRHQGDFRRIVEGINSTLDAVIGPLNMAARAVDRISKGDIPPTITENYNGDFNQIKNNLNTCCDAIRAMIADAADLNRSAIQGHLAERADASRHQGDYRTIIQGVNDTLDAVIGPLNMAAGYVDRISKGDIPPRITDTYSGDFNVIKNNLNTCCDAVDRMVADARSIAQAAIEGHLDQRADASRHQGDYGKVIQGLNDAVDALVNPLRQATHYLEDLSIGIVDERITSEEKGDYVRLKEAFNRTFDAVQALVADANSLAEAAIQGRLETRADDAKHQGDFRKVVQGVNSTLDALITPVNEAAAALARVAERDLTARMTGDYRGDLSRIKESLNSAVENLDQAMQQVSTAVDQVAAAAGQIGQGSQSLAQGASEQASSLEEVGSSLQEMASMTRKNVDGSREASGLAEGSRTAADRGLESMTHLSAAMEKIKSSADATAKIVKTIDEIAFQTNLLALNAAVEAARAGDAGKGFAVVAEEVRNLAMRSAEAAKNTANLIEESVQNTENGVELNRRVLTQLQEITGQANKVGEVMSTITAGSEQQSAGIDQIRDAVEQMNQLTQQNAANSEESASASEQLSSQAEELRSMVAAFRISGEEKSGSGYGRMGSSRAESRRAA